MRSHIRAPIWTIRSISENHPTTSACFNLESGNGCSTSQLLVGRLRFVSAFTTPHLQDILTRNTSFTSGSAVLLVGPARRKFFVDEAHVRTHSTYLNQAFANETPNLNPEVHNSRKVITAKLPDDEPDCVLAYLWYLYGMIAAAFPVGRGKQSRYLYFARL